MQSTEQKSCGAARSPICRPPRRRPNELFVAASMLSKLLNHYETTTRKLGEKYRNFIRNLKRTSVSSICIGKSKIRSYKASCLRLKKRLWSQRMLLAAVPSPVNAHMTTATAGSQAPGSAASARIIPAVNASSLRVRQV